MTEIYTDGGCRNCIGGWAWLMVEGDSIPLISHSGREEDTTSQRMEMLAVIKAIDTLRPSRETIKIVTDSAYVTNCIRDKWYIKWRKNGWKSYTGKSVKNQDLWTRLLALLKIVDVEFRHIKGHSGNKWNDMVDELCTKEINSE